MSIIKNLKVSKKLWLIVIPAIFALILLLGFFIYRSNEISQESKKALYDETYVSTAAILNADRDFYQAEIAEKELYLSGKDVTADKKKELIATYNENVQQVQDRINSALNNVKGNPELYSVFTHPTANLTLAQLGEAFQTEFKSWQSAYNLEDGTGDMNAKLSDFDTAREKINLMTELLEKYANKRSTEIQNDVKNSIIASVIIILSIILLIFILSTLIVRYLQNNIKYITNISKQIAQGELSIQIDKTKITRDEIGQLCNATGQILMQLNSYVSYINEITQVLDTMASGDMRITLNNDYNGEFASIKDALLSSVKLTALHQHRQLQSHKSLKDWNKYPPWFNPIRLLQKKVLLPVRNCPVSLHCSILRLINLNCPRTKILNEPVRIGKYQGI